MNKSYILISQAKLFNHSLSSKDINYIIENNILLYNNFIDFNYDLSKDILLEEIEWKYDYNNLRVPYSGDNKILQIKLHDKFNIYDYISSASLISNSDIICGDNFVNISDVFIGTVNSFNCNPNNISLAKKFVDINSNDVTESINEYNKIFVKTDDILYFYTIVQNESIDISNKVIITHNSDYGIDNNFFNILSKVKKQFSQNCHIQNNNLFPLPIGIENIQWFDHEILNKIRKRDDIKKEKQIYFFFNLHTHFSRKDCFEKNKSKIEWNKSLSKEEYFIELKKHKYAICPRGNGLDTHRIWECLYLDVIPIMLKKDFINIENLPIIFIDDWSDLNLENLCVNFKNIQLSKISMDYYEKEIYSI